MNKQLQKAIDLAAYTGDKIIVIDEKTDRGTVLMSLDEYEKIVFGENKEKTDEDDLTEGYWFDKIDSEITPNNSVEEDDDEIGEATQSEDDFLTSENDFNSLGGEFEKTGAENNEAVLEKDLLAGVDVDNPEAEENIYYYEEAPLVSGAPVEKEKPQESFTSVGEELKNRHNWEIPKNIKSGAQEVK